MLFIRLSRQTSFKNLVNLGAKIRILKKSKTLELNKKIWFFLFKKIMIFFQPDKGTVTTHPHSWGKYTQNIETLHSYRGYYDKPMRAGTWRKCYTQSGYCGASRNSAERRGSAAAQDRLARWRNISSSDQEGQDHSAAKQKHNRLLSETTVWKQIKIRVQYQCQCIWPRLMESMQIAVNSFHQLIYTVSQKKTTLMLHTIDSIHINRFR